MVSLCSSISCHFFRAMVMAWKKPGRSTWLRDVHAQHAAGPGIFGKSLDFMGFNGKTMGFSR